MDARGVVATGGPVRYRLTIQQRLPYLIIYAIIPGELAFIASVSHAWPAFLVDLLVACATFFLTRWFGVALTPDEAVVHNLRQRRIAWRDVQTIEIERFAGNRIVVLYETNGRRTRLRAPSSGFLNWDRRFQEKFDIIGQWWVAHR